MKEILKKGYSFSQSKTFTEYELKKMATDCGDTNFIHHDSIRAANTKFSGIIASGSAVSALFSAMIPTHFSQLSPMLGLEMSFKFLAPIRANVDISMTWRINNPAKRSDSGLIVNLKGEITDSAEKTLVAGSAKIILLHKL